MILGAVAWGCLMAYAVGQESRPGITAPASTSTTSPGASATSRSTVSLYLPMGAPSHLQASVISASPDETAFALGCMNGAEASECGFTKPITVTEGESTIRFTNTYGGEETSMTANPLTVQCELVGAHLDETPIRGASAAVCTSSSEIPGLGIGVSTATLAGIQINYVPVVVTAGLEKILAAATMTPPSATDTSTAGAPARTAIAAGLGLGGAVGMALFGIL